MKVCEINFANWIKQISSFIRQHKPTNIVVKYFSFVSVLNVLHKCIKEFAITIQVKKHEFNILDLFLTCGLIILPFIFFIKGTWVLFLANVQAML